MTSGRELTIRRDGVDVFPGMVRRRLRRTSDQDEGVRATLVHRGYQALRRWPCDAYVYDEDGDPLTTRDAVKVNPWLYRIFRQAGGALDSDGNEPGLDGARVEDVARCLIGTRLIVQHDYQDNTPFLASDIFAAANKVQVYVDGQTSDNRPKLQRARKDSTGYLAGQAIESIPLENGDPDVGAMGIISTVTVLLIGELTGTQHPTIRVCRNARAVTRTYTSIALTHAANYLGSGLSAWTGTIDLSSDGAADKNSLAYELTIPGSDGDATTTKIHYLTAKATTVSDIGLTEGSIATYADPHGGGDETEWVEDDYQGMRRGDALERLRKGTLADPTVNPSPHWDMWVTAALAFNFAQRRGTAQATTYSHANANLRVLEREDYGDTLAYQVIAVGGGRGKAEILLVDRTAFTSGGLYDATRDPDSGALYGDLPDVLVFRDQSVTQRAELRRRARAYMAYYLDPRQFHKVAFYGWQANSFDVGDELSLDEPDWGLTGELVRVMDMDRAWDGDAGEDLTCELGEKQAEPASAFGGQRLERERAESRAAGATATNGVGGPGVYFDKDHYGRIAFGIPEGVEIERVVLKLQTIPWQAHATGAASGGGTTATSSSGGSSTPTTSSGGSSTPTSDAGGSSTPTSAATAPGATDDKTVPNDTELVASTTQSITSADADGESTTFTFTSQTLSALEGLLIKIDLDPTAAGVDDDYHMEVVLQDGAGGTPARIARIWLSSLDSDFSRGQAGHGYLYMPAGVLLANGYTTIDRVIVTVSKPGTARNVDVNCIVFKINRHTHPHTTTHTHTVTIASHTHTVTIAAHTHTVTIAAHTHDVTLSPHTHRLSFGIFQFDGDGNPGTGSPVYGQDVMFAVDPTLDAAGEPTTFSTERHPAKFGSSAAPRELSVDVTGYLRVLANGIIAPGEHRVYFIGTGQSGNTQGLTVVSVTPILKVKEAQGA